MNTNSNTYTIVYSAIVVILVAAILAYASTALKPMQEANAKAETISQMLVAAHFDTKENLSKQSNDMILKKYSETVVAAFTVNSAGEKVRDLNVGRENPAQIEIADNLKAENTNIKSKSESIQLPVYILNINEKKVTVLPIYGAGLWGPIWGYIALDEDLTTIIGTYFDHSGETPGLGSKIKDDPSFRARFEGKIIDLNENIIFNIIKGGAPSNMKNAIDAISGATMTTNGLREAINVWLEAYKPYITNNIHGNHPCCQGKNN